jgi:septal ring factor EnvC (AmiA/AmiB activator)
MRTEPWSGAGATLSDKSARKEYGLNQEEIIAAMKSGKLKYRLQYMHGNPWYRLLRSEVEALVKKKRGKNALETQKLETELAQVKKEIRSYSAKAKKLNKKRDELASQLQKVTQKEKRVKH